MMQQLQTVPTQKTRQPIRCPHCGKAVFDGDVIKSRVLKIFASHSEAKCQCKTWVKIPLVYEAD